MGAALNSAETQALCPQGRTDYEACFAPFRYCPIKGCGRTEAPKVYEYPLHGECETRTQAERRRDLVNAVAEALHANVCDPRHEAFGPWDKAMADEMVTFFERRMTDDAEQSRRDAARDVGPVGS